MTKKYCIVVGGSGDVGKCVVGMLHSQKKHHIISTYFKNYNLDAPTDVLQIRFNAKNIDKRWLEIGEKYPIAYLVFLVGVRSSKQTIVDTSLQEWENLIEINALSFLKLFKMLSNNLRENHARIIVVSSSAVVDNKAESGPYSASKLLLESIVCTLSKEEEKYGIGFNIIAPSLIDSRLARELVAIKGYKSYEEYVNIVLKGKILSIESVARKIVDIINLDAKSFNNGQIFRLFP